MITPNRLLAVSAFALAAAAAAPAARAADATTTAATPAPISFDVPVTYDNELWYRAQPISHDPYENNYGANGKAKARDIMKNMIHFEHTDTGGLIWNSFTMTALFADLNERSSTGQYGGSQEIYATYRGDISATGFGHAPITLPGVSDLQFEFGGDMNAKDDAYQARRRFLLVGPNFVIDLPGSVTFAVHAAKEYNHDSITGLSPNYHVTWNTELSYTEYLDSDRVWRWEGIFNMTGPKGTDVGLPGGKTVTEFYTYNQIVLDVGQLIKMPPHKLDLFGGVQYWVNKFGYNTAKNNPGATELTPYLGIGVHF